MFSRQLPTTVLPEFFLSHRSHTSNVSSFSFPIFFQDERNRHLLCQRSKFASKLNSSSNKLYFFSARWKLQVVPLPILVNDCLFSKPAQPSTISCEPPILFFQDERNVTFVKFASKNSSNVVFLRCEPASLPRQSVANNKYRSVFVIIHFPPPKEEQVCLRSTPS